LLKKTTWKSEKKDKKRLDKRDYRPVSVQFMAVFDCIKKGKHQYLLTMDSQKSVINGSLSAQNGMSSGCRWRNGLQIWRISVTDS